MKITHHQDSPRYKNFNFLILINIILKSVKLDTHIVVGFRGLKMEWQAEGRWGKGGV
jgi:hypothetical protein